MCDHPLGIAVLLEIEYKLLTLAWPDKHSPPLTQNAPFSLACTRSIPLPSVPPSSWLRTSNTNGQSEQTRLCVLSPGFCVRRVFFALNHQLVRVSCCSGFPSYRLPTTQTRRWTRMSLARWRLLPRCCLTSVQSGMFLVSERKSKKPKIKSWQHAETAHAQPASSSLSRPTKQNQRAASVPSP